MNRRDFLKIFGKGLIGVAAVAASPATAVKAIAATSAAASDGRDLGVLPSRIGFLEDLRWRIQRWWLQFTERVPKPITPEVTEYPSLPAYESISRYCVISPPPAPGWRSLRAIEETGAVVFDLIESSNGDNFFYSLPESMPAPKKFEWHPLTLEKIHVA